MRKKAQFCKSLYNAFHFSWENSNAQPGRTEGELGKGFLVILSPSVISYPTLYSLTWVASHAGVFRGARISSLEIPAPLKNAYVEGYYRGDRSNSFL